MTSLLSFSLRLCFKPLKRLSYDCQCLLTHVCLLCMSKVHRWKFFHCLCGFLWQFTWVYSLVKWVIISHLTYDFSFSFFFNFFTHNFCMWNLSWLICQHWLSYDKLNSNNINNNNNVSVIQVCVSKLTAHRVLILYNAYVAALAFVIVNVDSVLFVD